MPDQIEMCIRQRRAINLNRSLVARSEEADSTVEAEEDLIADPRGGRTPSQVVAQRLDGLLGTPALGGLGEGGRAEDARHLLGRGRGDAPCDTTPGIPAEGEGAIRAL